jgi:hypothetical protein
LIGLLFSNSIFAGYIFEKRCKVEYTQLNLITGTETIYKETSQFEVQDACKEGLKRLTPKVDKWIKRNSLNIISKINEFRCKDKNISDYSWAVIRKSWGVYRTCETYAQKLSAYLVDKYPNQIGASIYQEFNSIETTPSD